jgi:hypothetical protein
MEPGLSFVVLIPFVFIIIAIAIRVAAGSFDHNRVRQYVENRGGKVIEASWAPFGPGWFGGNRERIYRVRYLDGDGNVHDAFAKTNMLSGVYFTEDHIVQYAKPPIDEEEVESLEEENARLRAELDKLKRKERDKGSDAIQE